MKPGERKDGVGLEREYSLFFSWLWQVASGWHFLKKKYYWKIKYTKRKIFRPADSLCKWLQGLELSPNEAGSRSLLLSRGFLYCFEMIHVVEKKNKVRRNWGKDWCSWLPCNVSWGDRNVNNQCSTLLLLWDLSYFRGMPSDLAQVFSSQWTQRWFK